MWPVYPSLQCSLLCNSNKISSISSICCCASPVITQTCPCYGVGKTFYCMRAIWISVLCTKDLQCVMLMAMRMSVHTPVSLSLADRQLSWQPTTLTGQSCCYSWLQWCVAFTWDILPLSCRGPLGRLEVSPVYSAAVPFSPEMFLVHLHP